MSFSTEQLDLLNLDSVIYFQAPASHRLRIATSHFEKHTNLLILREFIRSVFPEHVSISMTGIVSYHIGSKRVREMQYLKNTIKLSNWKEKYVLNDEGTKIVFTTVKNITTNDVYALCKQTAQGRKCSNLMFYTEDRVLYISADVFDLVMTDTKELEQLCTKFHPWIDTYYPNIKSV
ncbi:hypothetical protein SFC66_16595 [Terribacillus saccharophilus]|uniref:hypothetical protein n=1 Tax=Terribacillus saccharophilus TaxID=361277 RepID=UPI003982022D